jgi:hypothetical protein
MVRICRQKNYTIFYQEVDFAFCVISEPGMATRYNGLSGPSSGVSGYEK